MMRAMMTLVVSGFALTACATAPAVETPVAPMPAPPPQDASAIPAGTHLMVALQNELNTTTTQVGDVFTATVVEPLIAVNGQTVVPQGAVVTGMVTGVGRQRAQDPAVLRLNFVRIAIDNVTHPITADIVGTHVPMERRADHAQHAQAAAAGAITGAVVGTIISGRLRDALIGGALGAAAGTIISLGVGTPDEAVLPAGTHFTVRTADRINLR
jgi:hypothetical protein